MALTPDGRGLLTSTDSRRLCPEPTAPLGGAPHQRTTYSPRARIAGAGSWADEQCRPDDERTILQRDPPTFPAQGLRLALAALFHLRKGVTPGTRAGVLTCD